MANLVTEAVLENASTCHVNSSFLAMPIIKTVEGISIAYGILILMSLLSVVIGAFRSVSYLQRQKELGKNLYGNWNCYTHLVVLHFLVNNITQDSSIQHICLNLVYTGYFFLNALAALTPLLSHMTAFAVLERKFIYNFTFHGVLCSTISTGIFVWYLLSKHWIPHDLIGFAFAVRGIEVLQWANFVTGYGSFGGLSIFDYWIGSNGPPPAFTSSSAPFTQLVFPLDLLENGLDANNFATFGRGSILFPGVFLALVLRFDGSLNRGTNFYFNGTLAAYLFGLAISFWMKHLYGFYYPALLFCACLGTPLFLALVKGDITAMFRYDDFPSALPADEMPDDEMHNDDVMPAVERWLTRRGLVLMSNFIA